MEPYLPSPTLGWGYIIHSPVHVHLEHSLIWYTSIYPYLNEQSLDIKKILDR